MLALIEDSLRLYAERLHRGDVPMAPADLERLHRLQVQIAAQLDKPPERPPAEPEPARLERTPEHAAAVVAALRECGALEALGLRAADSGKE
jgi:hypothetical protein